MNTLSRLMVRASCNSSQETISADLESLKEDLRYVGQLNSTQLSDFRQLADTNHVVMRALTILKNAAALLGDRRTAEWCETCLTKEQARIERAAGKLHSICSVMESWGCKVTVIKSLDHWPDLGSDLDLYTTDRETRVEEIMREAFGAAPVERSWGDHLANKWNYRVPGLLELVEVHVQFLGQTGEHEAMAKRVMQRRVLRTIGGHEFYVPAPEERIVISTLQRVYRHFYFRLCDMIDMSVLIQNDAVDFHELHHAADVSGIWPGVATFLVLIQNFVRSYGGELSLPEEVVESAQSSGSVRFGNGFLRVSKITAAGLYGRQLVKAGQHRDMRALLRLPLLPPLAITALVAHGLTGNDKGIW